MDLIHTRRFLLIMLCCLLYCAVACQTTTQNNQEAAQAAGLPEGALIRLAELIGQISDGHELRLKSAQKANNLQPLLEASAAGNDPDEIWCTLWVSQDGLLLGLNVFREGETWIDAFAISDEILRGTEKDQTWNESGCTNFVNQGR